MRLLECGCEVSATNKILSQCVTHGEHMKLYVETAKHPRGPILDKDLRDKLLVAAMPTGCERLARGDDADAVAEQTERLVHEIMRRVA